MIKLIDNQGMIETREYKTENDALEYLHNFHGIDWEEKTEIRGMPLNFMLDYGNWSIEREVKQ